MATATLPSSIVKAAVVTADGRLITIDDQSDTTSEDSEQQVAPTPVTRLPQPKSA